VRGRPAASPEVLYTHSNLATMPEQHKNGQRGHTETRDKIKAIHRDVPPIPT
jgi:hypothetical protein